MISEELIQKMIQADVSTLDMIINIDERLTKIEKILGVKR